MSHDYSQRIYERQLLRAAAILSPENSTAPARAGDIQAGAGASKLTASSSPADAENFCRCSAKKKPEFLVCRSCWWQAPADLRQQIRFGSQPAKRGAIRLMLEFARGRKVLRELGGEVISRAVVSNSVTQHATRTT